MIKIVAEQRELETTLAGKGAMTFAPAATQPAEHGDDVAAEARFLGSREPTKLLARHQQLCGVTRGLSCHGRCGETEQTENQPFHGYPVRRCAEPKGFGEGPGFSG